MNNIDSGLTEHNSGTANQPVGTNGSEQAVDSLPGVTFAPLRFDAAEFMQFVEDENLTPEQADELLRTTWEIMVGFVDIAFGISSTQQVVDRLPKKTARRARRSTRVLSSDPTISNNKDKTTSARATRNAGGE